MKNAMGDIYTCDFGEVFIPGAYSIFAKHDKSKKRRWFRNMCGERCSEYLCKRSCNACLAERSLINLGEAIWKAGRRLKGISLED